MSLFRTLKMLNVRFPHFLLSALQLSHGRNLPDNTWLLLENNRLVIRNKWLLFNYSIVPVLPCLHKLSVK